ncbi:MAG: hypothetical protein Q8O67_15590 [Deltaproteobacteria bacterium]|nr:hypothetical protein [Deltaproteobacteria bacterium]
MLIPRLISRFALCALALSPLVACQGAVSPDADADEGRALLGTAPAGSSEVLVVDTDGQAFRASPEADGAFRVAILSRLPVTVFVVADETRVLRVASTSGGAPSLTTLPAWDGPISTAQLSTAGASDVEAEDNPLEQIDSDDDGESDLEDADDDDDGESDDVDGDDDGSGADDDDEDLDSDDDGAPDLCDDDDDDDGIADADDEEDNDGDDDGVDDADDADDDNDGDSDDEDEDDDDDGIDDDEDDV